MLSSLDMRLIILWAYGAYIICVAISNECAFAIIVFQLIMREYIILFKIEELSDLTMGLMKNILLIPSLRINMNWPDDQTPRQ